MNVTYRSVWNHAIGAWIAVSEIARGRGKTGRGGRAAVRALAATALTLACGSAMADLVIDNGTYVVGPGTNLGNGSVTVDNAADAGARLQIRAGATVGNELHIDNLGTLDNAGTVSRTGTGVNAVASDGGATIINRETALIEATGRDAQGVVAGNGPVQVRNAGTIQATGTDARGIYLWTDGLDILTVNNEAGGKIFGTVTGVQLNGSGTVTNSGQISADAKNAGLGVYFGTAAGSVVNQAGGTITGIAAGVSLQEGGSVTNTGVGSVISATGAGSQGVQVVDGKGTIVNDGGRITGVGTGVGLSAGGTVTNTGAISATGAGSQGVWVSNGKGTVSNEGGSISGVTNGVLLWGGGSVVNTGGTISATTDKLGQGVEIVGGTSSVTNQGGGTIAGKLYGVSLADGGTITNTGSTIRADGTDSRAGGVIVGGKAGTVTNTGEGSLIQGPAVGVRLVNGGTVTNGVGATIQGIASVDVVSGNGTLVNAGSLLGNVQLSSSATNQVTLFTGSSIKGNLQIGTKAASTLTLDGTGYQKYSDAVSGTTSFAGTLVKQGSGTWLLDQASARAGGTSLKAGRLDLGHSQALGTGVLAMDDGTTLGFAADGLTIANAIRMTGSKDPVFDTGAYSATLAGVISGGGDLTKQGTGTLTLTAANTHTGATSVAQGTLRAGAANTFSSASAVNVAAGAMLDTAGFNQTLPGLANGGTVSLRSAAGSVGSTLTVTGAYVGNNGVLQLGTALGDSASASDRLLLSGAAAVASGSTQVQVTKVAGLGALTSGNGIPVVVTEGGARIEGNAFSLAGGHVDAGVFEYRMTSNAGGAWLSSTDSGQVPPPVGPGGPGNPADPANPGAPGLSTPLYRAEVPLIAALPEQLREANLAMLANRQQRVGDAIGAAPDGSRQAWGRVLSVQRDIAQQGAISPQSHGRLTGFQAGTDLYAGGNSDAQWQAGVYVGQLDGDMSGSGFARGIANLQVGRTTLSNQYLGAYGSYQDGAGRYADAVLQAARHRYGVQAIANTGVDGKGSSLLASLEVGQAFPLAPGWRIEPQLQIVHQSLDLDPLALGGFTTVDSHAKSGWSLRAGIRVQGELSTGLGTLQPYGRLNVYKSPNGTDSASYRTLAALTVIGTPTGGTRTEVALGATLALSERLSVYGEIGQLRASGGNTRTGGGVNASAGLKVGW